MTSVGPNDTLMSTSLEKKSSGTQFWVSVGYLRYRTSVNPSLYRSSCAIYCGARQVTGFSNSLSFVVSGGGSASAVPGRRPTKPAVPATASPRTKSRRLQLPVLSLFMASSMRARRYPFSSFFQLVQEAPVGALGDDLLRARLDHPAFAHPQRVEAHRVLGIVLAPLAERDLLEHLQGVVVAGRLAFIHHELCDSFWLKGTHVGRS